MYIFHKSQYFECVICDGFGKVCLGFFVTVAFISPGLASSLMPHIVSTKEALAIRRVFSLVDMITNTKFSNCTHVFKRISSDKASNLPKRDVRFILLK